MRNSYLYTGLVALLFASFYLVSCLNDDNLIPPNCYDGILNNGEEKIDCGGPCERCDPCENGLWDILEGETCIDCGGDCDPCTECNNCVQDINEFGIDCGGVCSIPCEALCDDGILNGNEEEIDCGGACEPCPTCVDGVMNGFEVGIDCGDPAEECPTCATDGNCGDGSLNGEEEAIDCGNINGNAGLPGYCPPCENSFVWTVLGEVKVATAYTATFDVSNVPDTVINITGTTEQNEVMTFVLSNPVGGWNNNLDLMLNSTSTHAGVYNDVINTFTTGVDGALVNMHLITVPSAGNVISGNFNGSMKTGDGLTTVSISAGSFVLNMQ